MACNHFRCSVVLVVSVFSLNAQPESNRHLAVHVSDPSGAVIPKAMVEVEPLAHGTAFTAQTDDRGNADLYLPSGKYQLSIRSPGFCFKKRALEVVGATDQSFSVVLPVDSCPGPCQMACITVQAESSTATRGIPISNSSLSSRALESPVTIGTAHNSATELATKTQLERLIAAHDLGQWTFTHEIVIDEKSIPHSHPVLTLHTRHQKQDDELLSTYLHEQLHWFLTGHPAETRAAEQDLTKLYPSVPIGYPDGAKDTESTYLHLLVCQLEQQADRVVLGDKRTTEVMQFWAGDHYRWVYRTVIQDEAKIEDVLKRHHLDTPNARLPD